jgi:hypothetical protein
MLNLLAKALITSYDGKGYQKSGFVAKIFRILATNPLI